MSTLLLDDEPATAEATKAPEVLEFRLQEGKQEMFGASEADITIYGGGAGGGKTWALLMEPLRHMNLKNFSAVIFRRTYPEIMNPGGLWDTSEQIYPHFGFIPRVSDCEWYNPINGMRIQFSHLQHEKDKHGWQGSAVPLLEFDELTHFTESTFTYFLSRNRLDRPMPVRPYMRGTCNPMYQSWVLKYISWWIDSKTGLPILERAGVIRYFVRKEGVMHWASSPEQLASLKIAPKSFTFIPALLTDNPKLIEANPDYAANLDALPSYEREQLKNGNWNVRPVAGMRFKREWFKIVKAVPEVEATVRYWDRASTEVSEKNKDPDWTAGVKVSRTAAGRYIVRHVKRLQVRPNAVKATIINMATQDHAPDECTVVLEVDPGSAGISERDDYATTLVEFAPAFVHPTGSKWVRSAPASAAAEAGLIDVLEGPWNEAFFDELEAFADESVLEAHEVPAHDDQVDGLSGAFNRLAQRGNPRIH